MSCSNLSKGEQQALKELEEYRDIVIKEADKGSAVVVWGIEEYFNEAQRQLGDINVYELVENPLDKVSSLVDKRLATPKEEGTFSEHNMVYLKGKHHKLGRFYLFLKIHKRLENVPGRPVVSNCGTATERISEFVDFHLQPIVAELPHIIKDTNDFLKILKELNEIPEGAILCTMDVVGLYPHIPHEECLESRYGYSGS